MIMGGIRETSIEVSVKKEEILKNICRGISHAVRRLPERVSRTAKITPPSWGLGIYVILV